VPRHEEDPSFDDTLTNLEQLHESYGEGEWPKWWKMLFKAAQAGRSLGKQMRLQDDRIRDLEIELRDYATRSAVHKLREELEADRAAFAKLKAKFWTAVGAIALAIFVWLLGLLTEVIKHH
jgi:hypothetical protein